MAIEQVNIEVLGREFKIGTPSEEKETLFQAVDMLNQKIDAIQQGGRIVETDKIVIMAALNVVHDLLKMPLSLQDNLAIGEFERKITNITKACDNALSKLN